MTCSICFEPIPQDLAVEIFDVDLNGPICNGCFKKAQSALKASQVAYLLAESLEGEVKEI